MAQKYLNNFTGVKRISDQEVWSMYAGVNNNIVEQTSATLIQDALVVNYSVGNKKVGQELVILTYSSFDETYVVVTGDFTYNTAYYFALVKPLGSSAFLEYKGVGGSLLITSDKYALLEQLKDDYGDGRFRVFQSLVQTSTDTFVLVP